MSLSESSKADLVYSLKQLGSSEQDQLREWLRQSGKESLFFLTKAILNKNKLTKPLHVEMADHVQNGGTKTLTLVPRGHYKTTIGAEGYPIWRLLQDCNDTILLANATLGNSQKFLRAISWHIESNEILRWVYPELIPTTKEKWTQTEICVPRDNDVKESSIEAIGLGGTAVGRHFRCLIKDDLVNEDHIISAEQMQKVIDWHKYSTSLLVHPGKDREHVQGTRWAYYDVYSYIMENEPGFKVFFRGDVNEDGTPIFPEEFDLETLRGIEARQGPYIYSCQYKNRPSDPTKAIFKDEWVCYIEDMKEQGAELQKLYQRCRCYVIIDPAISEKRSGDFTGIVVVFVDSEYNIYVEVAERFRYAPSEVIETVFRYVDIYNPSSVGLEVVSLAKAYKFSFEQVMREKKKWFYIEPLQPNTHQSKVMRVRAALQPLFAQRKVFIRKTQLDLKRELISFPLGDHDDIIDALAYTPTMWTAGDRLTEPERKGINDPFNMEHILAKLSHDAEPHSNYPFVLTALAATRRN
jgi:phage terminase large subunit-like protein